MLKGIPHIDFIEQQGYLRIYCDGELVGVFIPSQAHNAGERFMDRMRNLRLLVADEVVDTFRFIDEVVTKNRRNDGQIGN